LNDGNLAGPKEMLSPWAREPLRRKRDEMTSFDLKETERRMRGALTVLQHEFGGLRTGRASAALLDPIVVNAYGGSPMPLNQLATINVPEPRLITVQVWDRSQVGAVERAIRESDLGLNPIGEGQLLRLPIPELNQERRTEIAKVAHKYTEQARIAVRNVRRDGMEHLKKMEKDGDIGKDDHHSLSTKVQELTDKIVREIDEALAAKEAEIMHV
jgi:ribosome recycling factor